MIEQITLNPSFPFLVSEPIGKTPGCDCCACSMPEDRIDAEWFENWCIKQPQMKKIGKKLMKVGGAGVVTPYFYGVLNNMAEYVNVDIVADFGKQMSVEGLTPLAFNVEVMNGLENDPEVFQIDDFSLCTSIILDCPMLGVGIGFVLREGYWQKRIWLLDGSKIVETRVPGEAYFGAALYGSEAQVWAALWSGGENALDKVERRLRKFHFQPSRHLHDTLHKLDDFGCIEMDLVDDDE